MRLLLVLAMAFVTAGPAALRTRAVAITEMGPGETADFTYVPTQPGDMSLEVWIPSGMRIVLPVIVRARQVAAKP